MSRSAAVQLPPPDRSCVTSRALTWPSGVRVLGPMILIPGRTVHADDVAHAEAFAASILAAVAQIRAQTW